jgi:starvation-inducible outer membrane lipoprotein
MWLLVSIALLLTGCSNVPGMVKELSKSDRSWCLSAIGYGENIKVGGSGVQSGNMKCGDDGLTLQSSPAQIGVPLTIVPQLSVGQPTLAPPARTDGR